MRCLTDLVFLGREGGNAMECRGGRRYRAFISYSHRDRKAGDRLFKYLDGYRPPKALRGRDTAFRPVAKALSGIPRSRGTGGVRGVVLAHRTALAASDHLIVICSPNAAKSYWANEEVKAFTNVGKAARIHAALAEVNRRRPSTGTDQDGCRGAGRGGSARHGRRLDQR